MRHRTALSRGTTLALAALGAMVLGVSSYGQGGQGVPRGLQIFRFETFGDEQLNGWPNRELDVGAILNLVEGLDDDTKDEVAE
jgi:hypothetical protein